MTTWLRHINLWGGSYGTRAALIYMRRHPHIVVPGVGHGGYPLRLTTATHGCVLFSSHIMREVSALCDTIVIIAAGRIAAQVTPD